MIKKTAAWLLSLSLCFLFCVPLLAQAAPLPRVLDGADLLTDEEEQALMSTFDEISERQQVDVVVATVASTGDSTPMEFADDVFDNGGYGFGESRDGVLLLISMEERDWWISTSGYGITAFTDAGIAYIGEEIVKAGLSDGDYAAAFDRYATLCDSFITRAKDGNPYDVEREPFSLVWIPISLVIGFVIALCIVGAMKGKLKTVHSQPTANEYVRQGSMNVTESRDLFLYTHVDRREKPKENSSGGGSSTHVSSSGSTHGGGGGKF